MLYFHLTPTYSMWLVSFRFPNPTPLRLLFSLPIVSNVPRISFILTWSPEISQEYTTQRSFLWNFLRFALSSSHVDPNAFFSTLSLCSSLTTRDHASRPYKEQARLVIHLFIQVVCLTTGPKPLPKRALHIVRSRASSFIWEYPLLSLRLSNSFLRLLLRLPVTSITLLSFLQ